MGIKSGPCVHIRAHTHTDACVHVACRPGEPATFVWDEDASYEPVISPAGGLSGSAPHPFGRPVAGAAAAKAAGRESPDHCGSPDDVAGNQAREKDQARKRLQPAAASVVKSRVQVRG